MSMRAVIFIFLLSVPVFGVPLARLETTDLNPDNSPCLKISLFRNTNAVLPLPFRLLIRDQESPWYFVTVDNGQSRSSERFAQCDENRLIYRLYADPSGRFELRELLSITQSEESLQGKIDGRTEHQHVIYLGWPANQTVPPGWYTDTLNAELYLGDPLWSKSRTRLDRTAMRWTFQVMRSVSCQVLPETLSEADLNRPVSSGVVCTVKANVPYRLHRQRVLQKAIKPAQIVTQITSPLAAGRGILQHYDDPAQETKLPEDSPPAVMIRYIFCEL